MLLHTVFRLLSCKDNKIIEVANLKFLLDYTATRLPYLHKEIQLVHHNQYV